MLKGIVIFFALVIGTFIGFHHALQNGTFLTYLDTHPDPVWTPRALYTVGQGYYLFQGLPEAATYFVRIPEKFPKSAQSDDAAFFFVQVQDDLRTLSRDELIDAYQSYVDQFPAGKHAEVAKGRIGSYRTGAR